MARQPGTDQAGAAAAADAPTAAPDWLVGGGRMGDQVRAADWSRTVLGPLNAWPHALRVAVNLCLNSKFPMFVWWGPDLVNVYNDAYVPILGKRHPAALGRPARDTWAEIWSVVGPQADAVMARGEATWNERVRLDMERHGHVEETYFTWSYSPIHADDGSGRVAGLFCACTEDTARVAAERERDRLAAQRQLALDAARMGWWHYDPITAVATFDGRYAEIFGVTGVRRPNDEILRRIHPDDLPGVWAKVEAALDPVDPQPYSAEFRIRRDDGSVRWLEAHGLAAFDGDGPARRATSFVGTVADVTDRRHAAEQPRRILESITDAFFALDAGWRFTYVNPQAERALGRQPGDLLGKVIWDEYPGLAGTEFERAYHRAAGERVAGAVTAYYPDHDRWYEVHVYPAAAGGDGRGGDGAGGGISVYFRDVTDRRRAEEELRRSHETFYNLIQNNPFGVYVVDADFRLRQVSLGSQKVFSTVPPPLLGRDFADVLRAVWDEPFATEAVARFRHTLATGEPYASPRTVERRRDIGEVEAYDWRIERITLPDGRFGVVCYFYDLSERERWEAALGASEERLRLAQTAASLGTWELDVVTGAAAWSDGIWQLLELPPPAGGADDLRPTLDRWAAYMHPDDRDRAIEEFGRQLAAGARDFYLEFRIVTARGGVRWLASRGQVVWDASGAPVQVLGAVVDITERKQSEAALRDVAGRLERQSRLFERVASTTPDFIYVFDLDGRFLYANRRLLEVWGRSFEDAVGKSLYELGYPQWHADMHVRELRQVIETKRPIKGEVPFTGGSGISGIYEYIFTPVLGPGGEVEAIAGTTRDVTDRRRADERLARDALLLANVRDSVIVTDLAGVVTFWNEGATRLFGWTADEVLGKHYADRLPEPSRAAVADWIRRIAAGEAEFSGEWEEHRKDGSAVWIEATTRLIHDPAGRPIGIMGVARDIADRKRAEAEAAAREAERERLLASERAARGEAEQASRMKDEFLATLGHELRTPLNAILGWSQILRNGPATEDDLDEGLRTIERNARAQTQIIEDLLDMSRIISGKVRLDVERVDLAAVVRAALDTVRPAADAKGVRLIAVLATPAGPVSGDPNRLQQVFWNLLSNAVKFTPRGGRVQVVLERVNSHLDVGVTDTGEGIRPDFLPHVFDRFRQADASTTRRHGGLGLGLAIAKQLVELHGGTIRAASPGPGAGATFVVSLPLTIVHPDPDPPAAGEPRRAGGQPAPVPAETCARIAGLRVLVVDDEADARALVRRVLEGCNAVVTAAGSAAEAVAAVERDRPDVMVSDVGMPGEDGYALIRRVRALGPDRGGAVPAVALTAYARAEDRVRAVLAGFQMHVPKPVEPAELIAMVASLAGRTG